ncbi:unnamed protein product [Amoebophrya sp. A120]|nr:unnamed protein product [Amoebophrya sp. A120]|eukprot:GSA120T00000512001.1
MTTKTLLTLGFVLHAFAEIVFATWFILDPIGMAKARGNTPSPEFTRSLGIHIGCLGLLGVLFLPDVFKFKKGATASTGTNSSSSTSIISRVTAAFLFFHGVTLLRVYFSAKYNSSSAATSMLSVILATIQSPVVMLHLPIFLFLLAGAIWTLEMFGKRKSQTTFAPISEFRSLMFKTTEAVVHLNQNPVPLYLYVVYLPHIVLLLGDAYVQLFQPGFAPGISKVAPSPDSQPPLGVALATLGLVAVLFLPAIFVLARQQEDGEEAKENQKSLSKLNFLSMFYHFAMDLKLAIQDGQDLKILEFRFLSHFLLGLGFAWYVYESVVKSRGRMLSSAGGKARSKSSGKKRGRSAASAGRKNSRSASGKKKK